MTDTRIKGQVRPLFNFRLLPSAALAAIAGVLTAVGDLTSKLFAIILLLVIFLYPIITRSCNVKFAQAVFVVFACFAFYTLLYGVIIDATTCESGKITAYCRISNISYNEDGSVISVEAEDLTVDGVRYDGTIQLKSAEPEKLSLGAYVTVSGYLDGNDFPFDGEVPMNGYIRGVRYALTAENIEVSAESYITADTVIRSACYSKFRERLGYRIGGFCYSTVFGDTDKLTYNDVQAFRNAGAAHVFAVSGLHVGVLSGALLWLLKLLKIRIAHQLPIIAVVLLFYAYITGFSPSVLRASFMLLYGLTAAVCGKRRDVLSAVGFSVLPVLAINPLSVFDVSFQLSYLAVLGIVCLTPVFKRLFRKLPKKANEALSVSLAATIGITALSVHFFGWLSLLSVPVNLVVIPIVSVLFILILIELLIAFVCPVVLIVNRAVRLICGFTVGLVNEVNTLTAVGVAFSGSSLALLLSYGTMAVVSEQCLVSVRTKKYAATMGCMLIGVSVILAIV